ncbi:MBL fold metallo-hydrolase [Sutcliffiella rhizosphaerae]|uniref:Metallo-hydrolase YflN n=1 Tax=Sutcliffiella rhizosphaerae TaxID=2880967 RepID=A0ABM8YKD1_9BACI|nr:MBL fold metallo-hydrolase [Sutcliffiella rhizosphaerae]CAG9620397.1 putative metallo-hydrolase YflN [Sutcliffiella rhizosphaerae]
MNNDLHYSEDNKFIPVTSVSAHSGTEVAKDLFYYTNQVVNICLYGNPEQMNGWVLIDTGMPKSAVEILSVVEKRFGPNSRPKAIILTHGHFDHVGASVELVKHWDVPIYAHEAELPFLTGKSSYPEPDPTVEGGLVAKMSSLFPNEPTNLGDRVEMLPSDGTVPGMDGWRWIHTPGHSPGHVAFFLEEDRTLIAGDAFVTVRQDSLYKVLVQQQEVCGPPRYFTTDWYEAWESVKNLAALNPRVAVTGHGTSMSDEELTNGLTRLVQDFENMAIPDYGRYI